MSNAELYALAKHNEVCKKWFHGKKCVEAGLVDIAFYALIKGESQKDNETVVLLTEGEK